MINTYIDHGLAVHFIRFHLNKIQKSGLPKLPTDPGAPGSNLTDHLTNNENHELSFVFIKIIINNNENNDLFIFDTHNHYK